MLTGRFMTISAGIKAHRDYRDTSLRPAWALHRAHVLSSAR
jgi:hypothetical protein